MEKIDGVLALIERNIDLRGKVVADIGCGTGAIAAAMAELGASVYAIDTNEVIEKVRALPPIDNVIFYEETENWLSQTVKLDLILFSASLHHIPADEVVVVLNRLISALSEGGLLMFIEPVNRVGHYIELTSLIEEERDKLLNAYKVIKALNSESLTMINEEFYYLERTIEVYKNMAAEYISDPEQRAEIISQAEAIVHEHLKLNSVPTIFRSVVRLNLFRKDTNQQHYLRISN